MKEIKWVTPCHQHCCHWESKMDTIKSSLTFSSHLNKYKWTQRGLILPVASFAADVHVSSLGVANTNSSSPGRGFVKSRRMRVFSRLCFAIPALSAGQQRQRFDLLFISIVIQNYCQRIKDRFGKNLPGLIWMLFGRIIFFQLRVQDMERFYFWPEIPVYERSYF